VKPRQRWAFWMGVSWGAVGAASLMRPPYQRARTAPEPGAGHGCRDRATLCPNGQEVTW